MSVMDLLYTIFISPIEVVLHLMLLISYSATGHYGASLLILSLCVNLALLPIYHIADKWQQAERDMQNRLRPKLQEFREAFSGEERFMMIRTLYRQAGYHPIYAVRSSAGFLIQIPFFIAAYHLLSHYPPLEGVPAFIFEDLSKPDALLGGINVMPFVMTFVNLLSTYVYAQKLRSSDVIQLCVLSVLFLILLYGSAVALLLYWTFNNVFSLLKNMAYARLTLNSTTSVGLVVACRRKLARFVDLPTTVTMTLFLIVVAVQAAVPMNIQRFSSVGRVLEQSRTVTLAAIGTSIVILAYLCMAFWLKTYQETRAVASGAGFQRAANVVLVWLLFAGCVVVNGAWLSNLYPDLQYGKIIGGILLMLSFLLFAPPICGSIKILRRMPDSHLLYILSTSLIAFAVFVANPISFYVHSGDYSGGVFSAVLAKLLVYCFVALFACTSFYLAVDNSMRKSLTLLAVFAALSVIAYSVIGVKNAGVMMYFELEHKSLLFRRNEEILVEGAILFAFLIATAYTVIYYRELVTQAIGAMLLASICVTAVDGFNGDAEAIPVDRELPVDHQDIVGFSRERNVLLILLDGFSGGYVQTILNETPDILREYEGFVWYPNMLTTHAGTLGAIASLAGGYKYTVGNINTGNYGTIGNAIKEAYRVYPDAFIPEGYQVTYVHPYYNKGCGSIDKRVHCTDALSYGSYYHSKEEPNAPLLYNSYSHLPPILSMVSLFKASPFFLKHRIYDSGNYLGARPTSVVYREANSHKAKYWGFLRVLAHESNADRRDKTFKFIHLEIPHLPYALSADCRLSPPSATVHTEMVCALKEVGVLLSWMKKNGVYDVTKIVVVSDHGWWVDNPMFPSDFSKAVPEGYDGRVGPGFVQSLLLVKDFGAKGQLSRSDTFLSTADVPSIVCVAVGGCRDVGPNPITHGSGARSLTFVNSTWDNLKEEESSYFNIREAYEVRNSIFDPRNWSKIK
jgi:YidC/Oxa1 family membrane protein insertase